MPREKDDAAYLYDMLYSARAAQRHVSSKSRADYDREELLRDAVERRLEIIGEAARGVSEEFQAAHPEVPWRKVMGFRHVLAHDYDEIDHNIVWRIVTVYVPELIELLTPLLPPPPFDREDKGGASS